MKKSDMEMFFHEAKYLNWEDFQRCMINHTDSYEVCEKKLIKVLCCFSQQDFKGWKYFKAIYDDIPIQFKMPLMLGVVYQSYYVDYPEMLRYISSYLREETPELKKQRIARNRADLGRRVRKDGTVKLYRGIAENFLLEEYAVSYTLDKKVADFFVEHHEIKHKSRFGTVICRLVKIEDILCYSNERKEKEVCIVPNVVHECECYSIESEHYPLKSWNDMEYLNEYNLQDYIDYEEYEAIMEEIQEKGA